MRHTLAAINDSDDNASKICKLVNVLLLFNGLDWPGNK